MRRIGYIFAALAVLAGNVRADQGWQDNQDGNNFACFNAGSFSANNLAGGGATYSVPGTGEIVNAPLSWWSQSAWFVDPQNSSGNASDSNTGLTSSVPLLSWAELSRRLWGATASGIVTITAMSNGNTSDSVVMNVQVPLSVASYGYVVTAPFVSVYSGTITTYTAGAPGPAADDYEITDASIPSSFTASGLLSDGLLARTTSGAVRYFYIAKDLGSKTARVSVPVTANGASSSLTNGQTYEVDSLIKIYGVSWPNLSSQSATNSGIYLKYQFVSDVSPGLEWSPATFSNTWRLSTFDTDTAFQMSNVAIGSGITSNFRACGKMFLGFNWGLVRSPILIECGTVTAGGTVFQGSHIQVVRGSTVNVLGRLSMNDDSSGMLVLTGSKMIFSGSGNLSGVGNSGALITEASGGFVSYDNTPVVAGSSSSGSPISVNGTSYTVAALPVSDPNSGSGVRHASAPSYSAGCAQFNTSGILSSTGSACGGGSSFYQTWTDDTFTPLPQETFSTAGAGLSIADDPSDTATVISLPILLSPGSCTNCSATFDNFGRATAYSSGTAPVTSVTGTNGVTCTGSTSVTCTDANQTCGANTFVSSSSTSSGLVCTQPTIGNLASIPANTLVGNFTSGSAAPQTASLGTTSGVMEYVNGSPDTLASFASAANELPYGSGTNGQFAQSANYAVDNATFSPDGQLKIAGRIRAGVGADGGDFLSIAGSVFSGGHQVWKDVTPTKAGNVGMSVPGGAVTDDLVFSTYPAWTERMRLLNTGGMRFPVLSAPGTPPAGTGVVYFDSASTNLAVKNDAGTVNHGAQTVASSSHVALTGLADNGSWTTQTFQAPITACTDYVSLTCVSGATDLGGTNTTPTVTAVEAGGLLRGKVIATEISTPSSPSAGTLACWADSGAENWDCLSSSGVKNHGAQTHSNVAGQALTALGGDGSWTTQTFQAPLTACTDYVSVSCQGGTSDIGTGGSNSAVQVTAIHEAFGPSRIPFGNINASGQALVYDGAHIAGYPPAGDLSGSYVTGPFTACKINWYSEVINVVSSAWVPVSSMTTFTTNQAEQPCDHKATNGKLLVNVIGNALTGGSVLIYITRNGGGFGATLTVTSATTTGVHAASAATGSGSANDTYGLFFDGISGGASGTINFSAEAVLQ